MVVGLIVAIFGLNSTLAANININSGPIEFGQGVAQTVSCQSDPLTVTPLANFENAPGAGDFTFSIVEISGVQLPVDAEHQGCLDKNFTIKAYASSGDAITLDSVSHATEVVVSFDGTFFVSQTEGTTLENLSSGVFRINFDHAAASALDVYSITIETTDGTVGACHGGVGSLGTGDGLTSSTPGSSAFQIKRDFPASTSGLYWISNPRINGGAPLQIYADMTRDGGGWTLVVANSVNQWTAAQALSVHATTPPSDPADLSALDGKYSILSWADCIKKSELGFQYRIEADNYGESGGIWTANQAYSFVSRSNLNTDVTRDEQFGTWSYGDTGIEQRMPYYATSPQALLTTSEDTSIQWWGTLIQADTWDNSVAPWIGNGGGSRNPTHMYYWVR